MQLALQANRVGAELPRIEIVVRIPGRRPTRRRLEREAESQLLAPIAAADRYGVRLRAGPYLGVVERQVEPSAPGTNRHRPRPCKGLLTEPTGGATRRVLGPAGRWGRRLAGGGASRQAKQGGDAMDGRRRDGEPGRDVRQERIELGGVGAYLALPQVVRQAQPETRQQVRRERVVDRRRLPARVTRLLRLLEVVGQRARVDAQEPDLARGVLGRVAGRRLELGLEVL